MTGIEKASEAVLAERALAKERGERAAELAKRPGVTVPEETEQQIEEGSLVDALQGASATGLLPGPQKFCCSFSSFFC